MSFDEEPEGSIHDECNYEIHNLERQLAEAQAEIERMRPVVEFAETIERIYTDKTLIVDILSLIQKLCELVRDYEAKEKP
jgi:hypothetical protein